MALLNGQIERGDYQKVELFFRSNHPDLNDFYLKSSGGDVIDALKIGRLFRKYFISTNAPFRLSDGDTYFIVPSRGECRGPNCGFCASACALIWFGGVERGGTVGLHRPRTDDRTFAGLSPGEASTFYRQVLREIETYLDEMEVPRAIIETMVATSSGEIHWVDRSDDRLDETPSIAEWSAATCPGDTPESVIRKFGEFTPEQGEQAARKVACNEFLFAAHRAKLAPP